jgi:hypothetical protein
VDRRWAGGREKVSENEGGKNLSIQHVDSNYAVKEIEVKEENNPSNDHQYRTAYAKKTEKKIKAIHSEIINR